MCALLIHVVHFGWFTPSLRRGGQPLFKGEKMNLKGPSVTQTIFIKLKTLISPFLEARSVYNFTQAHVSHFVWQFLLFLQTLRQPPKLLFSSVWIGSSSLLFTENHHSKYKLLYRVIPDIKDDVWVQHNY